MTKFKSINLRLPKKVYDAVRNNAKKEFLSVSAVVSKGIEATADDPQPILQTLLQRLTNAEPYPDQGSLITISLREAQVKQLAYLSDALMMTNNSVITLILCQAYGIVTP